MFARHVYTHPICYAALLALVVFALLLPGVTHEAHAAGSAALLPDLVADPPDGVELATSTNGTTHVTSMLLRFNGYIHNKGPGAVDFRGSRTAVQLSPAKAERVKKAEEKKEPLNSPEIEEELAASPMHTFQRLFTTKEGEEETNIERAHIDETSPAELIYSSADGHNHWHLQRAAKYSLWTAAKSAEVAPAQKVGFCLDDSQHVETSKGPSNPVYSDEVPPFRDFCEQYHPNATSLFEGISPGWRDIYRSNLALQWVDVSSVLPGEYWLREDVNPLGVVKETGSANVPVYAEKSTIIPGFDAIAQAVATGNEEAKSITLTSKAWGDNATPKYAIAAQPQHGTLSAISGGKVTYTPNAGYAGADSFTFSAADPTSQFPSSPAVATVSIEVGEAAKVASVAIEGAPESMTAGTSVQLSAHVANDSPTITWAASGGTITQGGLYTAPSEPPAAGKVTVTATSAKGAKDQRAITIVAAPPVEPAPESPAVEPPVETPTGTPTGETPAASEPTPTPTPTGVITGSIQPGGESPSATQQSSPGTSGVLGEKTATARIAVDRPVVTLFGRTLVMTALPTGPGAIRLSAFLGARRLGTCVTVTPADRSFTCRVPLGKDISAHARIRVQATLHDGAVTARSVRAAAPVEPMRMNAHGASAGLAATFWCSPAALRSFSTLR
jgi:Lysyl oxidase/Bacterial Ig domain